MKTLIVLFFCVMAVLIAASYARTLLSHERAAFDAKVIAFEAAANAETANTIVPGEITALLSDGRLVRILLNDTNEIRPGTKIRVSERVAPWGETWYRVAE
ncbi:MAG: hypothetical protein ABL893_09425 [Hyphomicrobium sp.]